MIDIMDIHKSLDINVGTVMKNPEILKFGPDHLKLKKYIGTQLKNYLIY